MSNSESKPAVQILVAVIVALLVGGSAPWWWNSIFPKDDSTVPAPRGGGRADPSTPEHTAPEHRDPAAHLVVVSSGQDLLKGSMTFDLDTGRQLGNHPDSDIFWSHRDDMVRYLKAQNGALLHYRGTVHLEDVSEDDLLTSAYNRTQINGSANAANELRSGSVVLVRTNRGNYSKMRIEEYGVASPGDLAHWPKSGLVIRWVTYARR